MIACLRASLRVELLFPFLRFGWMVKVQPFWLDTVCVCLQISLEIYQPEGRYALEWEVPEDALAVQV